MKIIDRYLLKEITRTSLSVLAIFMIILTANTMLRLIEEASIGNFPSYLLFPLILIKITQYSIFLIPISLFLGITLSFGRLYSTNEMAVMSSSGLSPNDFARILATIIIPAAMIVSVFSLYITPSATEYRYKLEHKLNSEERIEEINAGRFTSSQSGKATFFVENIHNNVLEKIFFSSSGTRADAIENSKSAKYFENEQNVKYILLRDGEIREVIPPSYLVTRKTVYKEHGIQLGQEIPELLNFKFDARSTLSLFGDKDIESRAELQSRLLLPMATILLGFLALPLSYSSPRKGRYTKIFLSSVIYFMYLILISISEKLFVLGKTPSVLGMWWLHILVLFLVIILYKIDSNNIPRRT